MNKKVTPTSLICPECGNISKIWRSTNKQKEMYHKKKLYCVICKKEINHIELKDIDFFIAGLKFKEELTEEEIKIKTLIKKRGE
ncbi:MAG: hypothetical protein IJ097_04570 [Bacilli bacterium]|nr:hypothetical protein [Bacilli bacterium]